MSSFFESWHKVGNTDIDRKYIKRCYLCSNEFQIGDSYRWVASNTKNTTFINPNNGKTYAVGNFLICEACDWGTKEEMVQRYVDMNIELYTKFWWSLSEDEQ